MTGLDLARVHRLGRDAADEPAACVGAPAAGGEPQVTLDVAVKPGAAFGGHRRPGQHDGTQRGQAELAPRDDPGPVQRIDVRGRGTEERHLRVLHQPPQDVGVRVGRVPVVEHRAHAEQQRADQEVPHHPAGRGVEEHPVAGPQIHVEPLQLELLDEDAAVAVGDRLGQAGRAGREQDPERMAERDLLEAERRGGDRRVIHHVVPAEGVLSRRARVFRVQQGQVDDVLQARQAGGDLCGLLAPVVVTAAIPVPVGAHQHLGRELAEPVGGPAPAEVRRAAGPDRADARRGEHGDHGLRDVRQVGGDPVAGADAHGAQPGGEGPDLARERLPRQALQRDGLAREQQRVRAGPASCPGAGCARRS